MRGAVGVVCCVLCVVCWVLGVGCWVCVARLLTHVLRVCAFRPSRVEFAD